MKRIALLTALAATGIAASAQVLAPAPMMAPTASPTFVDRARVERVEPQFETVQVPRDECSTQLVTEARPVSGGAGGYGGAIVGGLAGGILGNQVGKGHGREAATAAGAVIGAITGDRIANQGQPQYEQAQREVRTCRTVQEVQQRPAGYRVTYEYQGHLYTTVMREQPGRSVPVRVSVTPVDERDVREVRDGRDGRRAY
jgi:uncharacterized protein YcfJ